MDEIIFKVTAGPALEAIKNREARMKRAALYSLRATGRVAKTEARRHAPVLKDPTGSYAKAGAYKRAWAARKAGAAGPIAGEGGPIVGLLKQSISSSRRIKTIGGMEFSLKVGPRGPRAHLYAAKEEVLSPYMRYGHEAATAGAAAIWASTVSKVWRA
jgi:hypothetical protein